jgi:hypothetical protein
VLADATGLHRNARFFYRTKHAKALAVRLQI